jgi:hydroxyacylglutathione hydrolase
MVTDKKRAKIDLNAASYPLTIDPLAMLDYYKRMIQKDTPNSMPQINRVAALDDNYVWIITQGKTTVVIDPGEAQPVIDWLSTNKRDLSAILITHGHHDHVGGIAGLLKTHPNLKLYANCRLALAIPNIPIDVNTRFAIDGLSFVSLDLSGHTPDQMGYYLETENALFCGDALFAGGCGRLFNGGTAAQMSATLARISALPDQTYLYCAHEYTLANLRFAQIAEPNNVKTAQRLIDTIALRQQGAATVPSLLGIERETNPFLRTEIATLHHAIDQQANVVTQNTVERFAYLRAWKDQLDATGILDGAI